MIKSRKISLRDILDESIDVDGVQLDARVDVIIRQYGTGDMAIEYFDMNEVYINTPQGLILLDQEQFKAKHRTLFKRFENECELKALQKASKAPAEKWHFEDDEVSA